MFFSIGKRVVISAICLTCAGSFSSPATALKVDSIKNNCQNWQIVTSPNPEKISSGLGLAANTGNDVWMVGQHNSISKGTHVTPLIEHWDGSKWDVMNSPATKDVSMLFAVAATSMQDVWSVGVNADKNAPSSPLIEHWDGKQWTIVASPSIVGVNVNSVLNSVAASSGNDVWAVGTFSSKQSKSSTLVEHWDGKQWSIVASPNVGQNGNQLQNVAILASNNAWAVGNVTGDGKTSNSLIEHWDGKQWSVVANPNVAGRLNGLNSISGSSPNDIWAVGATIDSTNGSSQPLIEHWDGNQWSLVPGARLNSDGDLQSVISISANDAWGAGSQAGTKSSENTLLEHWDGKQWSVVASPNNNAEGNGLSAICYIPATKQLVSVGTSYTKDAVSTLFITASC